ncbi:alpha-mannosidase [Carnobacterium sp.]|uniref:alpha-mannosidase n=1 Tax=Carnobacterium sp. TaxID=48221 RepID=UPI003C741C3D
MKKTVYILSHSHWDREWYLPYEQHHMRLIELMDDVLELFETDPEFKSFHLDGQTIILDDYLQVRPGKKDLVKKHIQNGKLKIGPFYILQDAFLTSSESNVRNILVGMDESKQWGSPVELGYFPDTFGNAGQTPQMMKQAGFDVAAFGRGVKPTGFNNVVVNDDKYASQFSEMWWKGPDDSEILGLLFANWYSNGNEIPTDKAEAQVFWETKLADAGLYTSTDHILMMNGCDHQPVQKDLSVAIQVANELYPEIEFVHTSFDEYLTALKKDLPENLNTVSGELTSQETEGWYTLANTASTRVYLKQWNTQVSRLLENIAEPLATMAYETAEEYPHDMLRYAWKTLMQNHPHDSICGCSVDEVHREMVTRFEKANEVGRYVADEAALHLVKSIDTSTFKDKKGLPFVVFNTSGSEKTGVAEVRLEIERLPFSAGQPDHLYSALKEKEYPTYVVENTEGKRISAVITPAGTEFGYDLPKDRFRQPFMARYVDVRLPIESMSGLSWSSFILVEANQEEMNELAKETLISAEGKTLENEHLKVDIASDGTLTILNKSTNKTYTDLLNFEDVGDIGNEYIFRQPLNDQAIYSKGTAATIEIIEDTIGFGEIEITHTLAIPISADELLEEEQKAVIEMRERQAGRSTTLKELVVKTKVRLEKHSQQVKFETTFDNQHLDHRLRVLFPTGIQSAIHYADSIFEVVERPNSVDPAWVNPSNPQHTHAFVNVQNDENGVTASVIGLNEYEIIEEQNQQTIAVTLLRAVGELGDWGYFPTPEAQCLGQQSMLYALSFHGENEETRTYLEAFNFQIPFSAYQTSIHEGKWPNNYQYAKLESKEMALTAFKRKEHSDEIITRAYNLTNKEVDASLTIENYQSQKCNLLEEIIEGSVDSTAKPYEIVNTLWEKNN